MEVYILNVSLKNQLEVSLVYCTNQTKNKAIEQSSIRKGSPMKGVGSISFSCTSSDNHITYSVVSFKLRQQYY